MGDGLVYPIFSNVEVVKKHNTDPMDERKISNFGSG